MERDEINLRLNELKRHTFFELLNLVGRVYIVIKYSENVEIGTRGFLPREKEQGLILVLNSKMHFIWDEEGISTNLAFGTSIQKCFIPTDDIIVIYSPELHSQLMVDSPQMQVIQEAGGKKEDLSETKETLDDLDESLKSKVVRVDFKKKRK